MRDRVEKGRGDTLVAPGGAALCRARRRPEAICVRLQVEEESFGLPSSAKGSR